MTDPIGLQRETAADLIGPHGGPESQLGFRAAQVTTTGHVELELSAGVYYVDGIRVELAGGLIPEGHQGIPWSQQPYPIALQPLTLPNEPYLVYLDVWERAIKTVPQGPVGEPALDGPDTSPRGHVIWQVRVMPYSAAAGSTSCADFPLRAWREELQGSRPRLRVRIAPPHGTGDPLVLPSSGGFLGAENHLYRVEIASVAADNADGATFVWSRDNGAWTAQWTGTVGDRLSAVDADDLRSTFAPGDWVELTWDTVEFAGVPATRVQVVDIEASVLIIDPDTASAVIESDPAARPHARIRRWDQRDTPDTPLTNGAITVRESDVGWIPLEDGIEIQFGTSDAPHKYRVGDYWTIPARTATADIVWPLNAQGMPLSMPPHGAQHHYAPLAWIFGENTVHLQRVFGSLAQCSGA
jgi:hypothetical protein